MSVMWRSKHTHTHTHKKKNTSQFGDKPATQYSHAHIHTHYEYMYTQIHGERTDYRQNVGNDVISPSWPVDLCRITGVNHVYHSIFLSAEKNFF